ncbi:MAG: type III pantothenate kinase [Candidatus Caenarcaniphilales bacterium]|nr:type III pantothenate kinase [Candidatus Caenarcaniphilales bacterium]
MSQSATPNRIISIGNSNLKLVLLSTLESGELSFDSEQVERYQLSDLSPEELVSRVKKQQSLILSVNQAFGQYLHESLGDLGTFFDFERAARLFSIDSLYIGFGADRLAAVIGAIQKNPKTSLLVVDLGTFTTINIVSFEKRDSNYRLVGSQILPGISIGLKMSGDYGADLPKIDPEVSLQQDWTTIEAKACLSTEESLICGQIYQLKALLRSLKEGYPDFSAWLTGGWSEYIEDFASGLGYVIDQDLVIRGGVAYLNKINR